MSHEDILPYNSTDQVPIQHELFERFLMFNPSKGIQKLLGFPSSKGSGSLLCKCCLITLVFFLPCVFVLPVPPFVPRDTLRAWQEKNHPWLELSDVHRETTENIRVTVIPFYMGMRVSLQ